ncbi:MAG TPA: YkgJ family cysteine cluster protein [Phycisphaerales bacterium]|nr:YkgJ family cysteine cluster protein [Phycisphaerales bacterium]
MIVMSKERDVAARAKAAKSKKKKPAKRNPCTRCTGLCCRYFALPIETPKDWDDFDDIRWYLCHEDVTVFVEEGEWYLNVKNKCRHLSDTTYQCEIYSMRPKICRGYKTEDCDLTGDDYDYEMHFTSDKQMEEYMRIKFSDKVFEKLEPRRPRRKKRS